MNMKVISSIALMALGSVAHAESYELDPRHTEIGFAWNQAGLLTQRGEWLSISGNVDFDPENVAATKVTVEIDANSLHTGLGDLDNHLKSADFFDVENNPNITFSSTEAVQTGTDTLRLTGDLTIKGQTTPVVLDVELTYMGPHPLAGIFDYYKGDWVAVEATGTVLRSDLGVGLFAPVSSDTVELTIAAQMRAGGWPE